MNASTISWILKNILLPLTPFLLGAVLRFFKAQTFGIGLFDAGELSFSMGILCLIVIQSANRLPDTNLGEAIANTLIFFMIFFLVMYACSTFIKVHSEFHMLSKIDKVSELLKTKNLQPLESEMSRKEFAEFNSVLNYISWFVVTLTLICIPTVLTFKQKYNLS